MAGPSTPQRLIPEPAALVAGGAGLAVALAAALVPGWRLEAAVLASGLPALLPAAEPPLGFTARLALALFGGLATGAALWVALRLVFGRSGPIALPRPTRRAGPRVRRADAHRDAPPRAPVLAARDLGTPFMGEAGVEPAPEPIERALPRDLDQPMAAFDVAALPPEPRAPAPVLPSLVPPATPEPTVGTAEGEQPSPAGPQPVDGNTTPELLPPTEADAAPSTLAEMIDRLDRGLADRWSRAAPAADAPPPADPALPVANASPSSPPPPAGRSGLAATLGSLRRMATGD